MMSHYFELIRILLCILTNVNRVTECQILVSRELPVSDKISIYVERVIAVASESNPIRSRKFGEEIRVNVRSISISAPYALRLAKYLHMLPPFLFNNYNIYGTKNQVFRKKLPAILCR